MSKKKAFKKVAKKYEADKLIHRKIIPGSYDYYQIKANNLIHDAFVSEKLSEQKLEQIAAILKEDDIKNQKKSTKSLKNIIKQTYLENFDLIKDLDGYRAATIAAGYPETTLNVVDEEIAASLKELLSIQDELIKTTTFTSTTFDDIVAFPKYPVNKPGFHVVGKTSNVDLGEQVIKVFEKDGYVNNTVNNTVSDNAKYESFDFDKALKNMAERNEKQSFKNEENLSYKDKFKKIMTDAGLESNDLLEKEFAKIDEYEKDDKLIELNKIKPRKFSAIRAHIDNVEKATTVSSNRDKINNANELFEKLATKAGKFTKEYWQAKHKLFLINNFMEDFYSGKKFEETDPVKPINFNKELEIAVNFIDGEDSEYKKSILRKIRPDKYK
jgi:hypothetical protein